MEALIAGVIALGAIAALAIHRRINRLTPTTVLRKNTAFLIIGVALLCIFGGPLAYYLLR
jgi:hypothetical protein